MSLNTLRSYFELFSLYCHHDTYARGTASSAILTSTTGQLSVLRHFKLALVLEMLPPVLKAVVVARVVKDVLRRSEVRVRRASVVGGVREG